MYQTLFFDNFLIEFCINHGLLYYFVNSSVFLLKFKSDVEIYKYQSTVCLISDFLYCFVK